MHTRSLLEILQEEYSDVYSMTTPMEIEQQEEIEDAETLKDEENVFYAGTRTSNN